MPEIAFKALVIGVLAHALYKRALFLVVVIVAHETGTRDLRRLGGLARAMPVGSYNGNGIYTHRSHANIYRTGRKPSAAIRATALWARP